MPFCPNCKYEYKAEITSCPDCDEKLLAVLPIESDAPEDLPEDKYKDWVQLARFTSDLTAKLVLETLRMNKVSAVILSGTGYFGQSGQMGPSSFQPVGGSYSLMIPSEGVAAADEICQAILGEDWEKAKLIDIERG